MRILVDFLPLMARGGGLQNARNLWRMILEHGDAHAWRVWCGPELGLEVPPGRDHVQVTVIEDRSTRTRLRLQNVEFRRVAATWPADVLFTPIGVPPLLGRTPRVFGWHDSTIAYPASPTHRPLGVLERVNEKLRARIAGMAGRRAARICVQTPTMAGRLSSMWRVPRDRFRIVPNGPSEFLRGEPPAPAAPPPGRPIVLIVAEPKNAKNLEAVPHVARHLAARGVDATFRITCEPPAADSSFARAIRAAGSPPLDFAGRIPHDRLGDVYRAASAVLLPSWLESFSATYVEAMHFGVPLVTSDMDFARDICADAALYADPARPDRLAEAVARVLGDPVLRARLRDAGFRRVADFPDWPHRYALYLEALEAAAGDRPADRPPTPRPEVPA